jgi:hypothetical protein
MHLKNHFFAIADLVNEQYLQAGSLLSFACIKPNLL